MQTTPQNVAIEILWVQLLSLRAFSSKVGMANFLVPMASHMQEALEKKKEK